MKKIHIILSVILVFALSACEDEANQWEVDSSYEELFRSLEFEVSSTGTTYVVLSYTKSIDATKYVFEFSQDSLEFNEIDTTYEVLVDTLTAYSTSSTITRTSYRTTFTGLTSNTGYSVRMKSVDEDDGLESEYSEAYFTTDKEQLIESYTSYADKISITWTQSDDLTHILVINQSTGDTTKIELTDEEIANATATIENLSSGTIYTVQLCNGTNVRGEETIKTIGIANGIVVRIEPGDSVSNALSDAVTETNVNLTVIFEGGNTYDVDDLTIPSGVNNIDICGEESESGELPVLNLEGTPSITDAVIGSIMFESVEVNGTGTSGNYLFNLGSAYEVSEFTFTDCTISSFKGVVRAKDYESIIGNIEFEDCTINTIGGYGIVNISGSSIELDTISFYNCTLTEITTQIMDVRSEASLISVTNCTLCNLNTAYTQLFRLESIPETFSFENNIIAGTNSSSEIQTFNFETESGDLTTSFASSYITTDLEEYEKENYEFPSITEYSGTTYDLFTDPDNGDFTIKSGAGFGGEGKAGDLRWSE